MRERPHDSNPGDPNGAPVWRRPLPRDDTEEKVPRAQVSPQSVHPEAALEGGAGEPEE